MVTERKITDPSEMNRAVQVFILLHRLHDQFT